MLLQEKNKLKSDSMYAIQLGSMQVNGDRIVKVRLSMARLLTVVNERKKMRSEYRRHLEQEYIRECKAQELKELEEKNQLAKE